MAGPIQLGPWPLGVDNVHDASHGVFQVPEPNQPPARLKAAVDVDIDDEGWVKTRAGISAVGDLIENAQRLWSKGGMTLVQAADSLLLLGDEPPLTLIDGPLACSLLCHEWPTGGDRTWLTDGASTWCVRDGVIGPWGLDTPVLEIDELPDGTTGTLRAGTYLVTSTLRSGLLNDPAAQESGALSPVEVELAAAGGFVLTQPVEDPRATHVAFYISACNGSEPMLSTVVAVTTDQDTGERRAALTVIADAQVGRSRVPLMTLGARCPPVGITALGSLQAFMLAAVGNALYVSRPGQPWLWDLGTAIQMFPAPITTIVGLQDGAWVGTEKGLYWLGGDAPQHWSRRLVDPAPVIPDGTLVPGAAIPRLQTEAMIALFATRTGFVAGLPGGQIAHLTQDRYHLPTATRVSIGYVEADRRFYAAVVEP